MYEMATGRLPFAGASPSDTVSNVLDKDRTRFRHSRPSTKSRLSPSCTGYSQSV